MNSNILGFVQGVQFAASENEEFDLLYPQTAQPLNIGANVSNLIPFDELGRLEKSIHQKYFDNYQKIRPIAACYGWEAFFYDPNTYMVSFGNELGGRVNFYLSKMTVVVPNGISQRVVKAVFSEVQIENIFISLEKKHE